MPDDRPNEYRPVDPMRMVGTSGEMPGTTSRTAQVLGGIIVELSDTCPLDRADSDEDNMPYCSFNGDSCEGSDVIACWTSYARIRAREEARQARNAMEALLGRAAQDIQEIADTEE